MARTLTYWLRSERDRSFAIAAVSAAKLNDGWQVQVKRMRTPEQNARLHAMLTDVADQLPWPLDTGEPHDVEWWKRRSTLSWLYDLWMQGKGERPEVMTTLGGEEFGILIPHTSDLDTEQCASLIEWVTAFGATNGVVFKDPKDGPPIPEDYR